MANGNLPPKLKFFPPLPGYPGFGPVVTPVAEGNPLFGFDSSVVPDIDFAVKDASLVESGVITNYENLFYLETQIKKTLARGDPVRLFLLTVIYQLVVQRSIVDSTGKQNLLKYSVGDNLDNLGARWGPTRGRRVQPQKAKTTLRFSRAASAAGLPAPVPKGTICQTNDGHQFETDDSLILRIGDLFGDISASAVNPGVDYNGFVPGQINDIVQLAAPGITTVANTTISSGGSPLEGDPRFRSRIWFAPESFPTTGPLEAYMYWAASASVNIIDVSPYSAPEIAGEVHLYVLMEGGNMPTTIELEQVYSICNDRRIRPLTDWVFSEQPFIVEYNIKATWYLFEQDAPFEADIIAKVEQAVQDYILWQRTKIGRDINPSKFVQYAMNAGAKWVDIPFFTPAPPSGGPYFTKVDMKSVAREVTVSVTYGGISDPTTPYRAG
jgi:phage-related baseplate assembly protein